VIKLYASPVPARAEVGRPALSRVSTEIVIVLSAFFFLESVPCVLFSVSSVLSVAIFFFVSFVALLALSSFSSGSVTYHPLPIIVTG
jgi:hypothetical protein